MAKREKWKQWHFWGSKTTADDYCSHEIQKLLLLGKKAMTNLRQHIKKQRHHFLDKAMVFLVVSYGHRLLCSSNSKESACDEGDQGLIPKLGSSSGEGNGNPLQYSCLENSMDREAWWATIHRVTKSRTRMGSRAHTHNGLSSRRGHYPLFGLLWSTLKLSRHKRGSDF